MGRITPSVIEIFEKNKHILTKLKNVENVKKSKNREHFIISVLKVGQGKKKFIFVIFVRFHAFLGGSKNECEKKIENILTPPKKHENVQKSQK